MLAQTSRINNLGLLNTATAASGLRGMSDDSSNDLAEISLMVGSQFAFTNVPRNFLIVSIIISILGISVLTIEPLLIENTDWEPVEAQIIDTGVSSMWCGDGWWDECEDNGHFPTVEFSWEIDGVNYVSEDYILYPPNLSSDSKANQWLENRGIIIGANITGYVNPNDNSEAVLVKQSWLEIFWKNDNAFFSLPCLFCNGIPIFLFVTARRFESFLPKERRKRYKLQRVSHNSWITPIEATELQAEARSAWLKKKQGSLSEEQWEELSSMAEYMDADSKDIEGGKNQFTLLLDGKKEIEIKVHSQGDLFQKISNIESDSFIMYLEDSKSKGRQLEFNFLGDRGGDDYLQIRELIVDEEIRSEDVNVEKNFQRIFSFIKEALDNANNDEDWWDES